VGHKEAKVVAEGYTNTYVVNEGYWETKNVFRGLHAVNDRILHWRGDTICKKKN
jgi:hypothetical protein